MSDNTIESERSPAGTGLNRRIALLEKTLREKDRLLEELQDSEKRYRRLFESAKDGILILDADTGRVVDVNPFLLQLLGYSYGELSGQYIWDLGVFKDIAASKDAFETLQEHEYIRYDDLPLETHDGKPIAVEFVSNVYLVDHRKVIQCNIRDITAQKRLKAERIRLLAAIEQAGEAIVMTDAQGLIQFVNPAFERMTGYGAAEVVGRNPRLLKSGVQDDLFYRNLWTVLSSGKTWSGRMVNKRKDGTLYTEETTIAPVRDGLDQVVNYVAVNRDLTEHLRLSAQFHQAQKMEAVGLLAGGVAHDFNNMLTVIIGHAELALRKVDPSQSLYGDLEEIVKAARHSTDTTRQLLAFARKQPITPVALELNQCVAGMLTMLRRLIGEDIDLAWLPENGDCPVKMDPVQVNQILANLCVNARDAIAGVGKITIETGTTTFDESYCAHNIGYVAGDYVLLAISDDGCGMDKETVDQIFEPFFTCKGLGQGTGLGLSTVYGIVKQNSGFINVYSEPGNGTTFRIYLPRYAEQSVSPQAVESATVPHGHGEAILLVEDEAAIQMVSRMMLEELGYRVLVAGTPGEAIELAEGHAREIALVITDVVMPEMNGRDLADRLLSQHPGMRILFMSGYTADVIAHRGVLDQGVNFMQKPFSMVELAVKVQASLGEK